MIQAKTIGIEVAVERGHRQRFGAARRVPLSVTVDVATKALADSWTEATGSAGITTDQVFTHAKKTKFIPKPRKTQTP